MGLAKLWAMEMEMRKTYCNGLGNSRIWLGCCLGEEAIILMASDEIILQNLLLVFVSLGNDLHYEEYIAFTL